MDSNTEDKQKAYSLQVGFFNGQRVIYPLFNL